jgi:tetratricopeptide (TPR) repeat protein
LGAVIIVLVGAAAFSAALGVPFHFEDRLLISENTSVHSIASVQETFGQGDAGPVVWLLYALNWAVTPGSAASFHAVNLALHLLNALLVFLICRVFIRPGERDALPWLPMAAGLLFALHPLTTESVNYVVGRSSIVVTTFSLGAVYAFLLMDTGSEMRRRLCLLSVFICVALALGSHRVALVLPLILIAADWSQNGSSIVRRIPVHGLLIAATIGVVVATAYGGADGSGQRTSTPLQMEADLAPHVAIARAADLSINRRSLSVVQSAELDSVVVEFGGNAIENFEPTNAIPGIALMIIATLGAAVALWSRHLIGLGLAWYALALVFGAVWARNGMPFSERAVYGAVAGLAIAVAGALTFIGGRQRVRAAAAACVVILLSICAIASFERSRTWLEEQTLWELARETAARSPIPYHRLAVMYAERGEQAMVEATSIASTEESMRMATAQQRARDAFAKAAEFAEEAVALGANDSPTRVLLGRSFHMVGLADQASVLLLDVLRTDPTNRAAIIELAMVHETRGNANGSRNETALAADLYERAMAITPPSYVELARYGRVLMNLGDMQAAQAIYARAAQMEPGGPVDPALQSLNTNVQRIAGIEAQAAQAMMVNPNDPDAAMALAMVGLERSDFMQVLYSLNDVLEATPENARAWLTLGFAQARMGQTDTFLERHGTAPPVSIDKTTSFMNDTTPAATTPMWVQLALTCAQNNLWDEAATYLLHAGENSGDPRLPLIILVDIARQLNNVDRYRQFLVQATQVHTDAPGPWLMICDMSIQMGNVAGASEALAAAERLGATPEELNLRRPQIEKLQEGGLDTIETVS